MPDDTFVVGSKAGAVNLAMARPVELGLYILGAELYVINKHLVFESEW